MSGRASDRRKDHKKTAVVDDSLRKREEDSIILRKQKKDDLINKRRQIPTSDSIDQATVPQGMFPAGTGAGLNQTAVAPTATTRANIADIQQNTALITSPDPAAQLQATNYFRRILSIERNPPIAEVIATGIVPLLVTYLTRVENPQLQFEAAWALTNIASGLSEHTRIVVENNAVPYFIQLLHSPNEDVCEQSIWALGNIAGDCPQYRDLVLNAGMLTPILMILSENRKISLLRNATWALSNLCRGKPQPSLQQVLPCLETLARLIHHQDDEIVTDACWALSYMSDGPNERIQAVIQGGVVPRLVDLLRHPSTNVQTPALRCVGNIVTGDDVQTQAVINCNALQNMIPLFSSPKKGIRKEVCWAISNITAGNAEQIQSVIQANILPHVVQLMSGPDFDVQKEATWAISNATSGGSDDQIKFVANIGAIRPLCDILAVQDARIVNVALEGLENMLRVGAKEVDTTGFNPVVSVIEEAGGIEKLEQLQHHQNQEIYERVVRLLERYFEIEDEEAADLAPATEGSGFGFGTNQPRDDFDFTS